LVWIIGLRHIPGFGQSDMTVSVSLASDRVTVKHASLQYLTTKK
jgi:hypothetical protein